MVSNLFKRSSGDSAETSVGLIDIIGRYRIGGETDKKMEKHAKNE